ncbi:MAG: hypothetical protein AAFQ07_07580, partial [Chloroflexota bacterium]
MTTNDTWHKNMRLGRRIIAQYWLWALRIASLFILLSVLHPPSPRTVLETPNRTVDAVHDHVCVHTRLIDEPVEWVIQRSLQLVREMGATTIV